MQSRIFQVVLSIVATFLALFFAFASSIEQPVYVGETTALILSLSFNILILIVFIIFHIRKKNSIEIKASIIIFLIFVLPFFYLRYCKAKFDSEKWKNTHNGEMIENLIDSKILIGKSVKQVEDIR